MMTPSILRCRTGAASRPSIAATELTEAHPIDGRRNGARDEPRPGGRSAAVPPALPSAIPRDDPVTTLKLHYDGWLALPAALRRKLGLDEGAALEVELVDGTIVLRPSGERRGVTITRGTYRKPFSSFLKKRSVALAPRRPCTRTSSTVPCWSTARQR